MIPKIKILNINIQSLSKAELLKKLNKGVLVTPNLDHMVKLQKDKSFYNAYQKSDWVICDSKILLLVSRFLGRPIKEAIPGSSFFSSYCTFHKNNPDVKIFLLGAASGVADQAMLNINKKVGREIILGCHSPTFGFEKNDLECQGIIKMINDSNCNVLVVGVGAPKQEKWIIKYKDEMPSIDLFMALGATIDFEAGNIKRAPIFFQKFYLEWLYRFSKEPKRLWKRYFIEDPVFFYHLLKQKLGFYSNPF
ncbi:glycosyl transferase [Flavobacterium sp. Root935]|uniref:WecB/TagA/CpsF family glycosyltransferase n=1 Tax=unclassified Flavobacterium TaxID=196869 RepID=UPI00070D5EED|nr:MULTISPECIES: WecB/TagA/CpsF family glycosyltransferase [unclassified Flavobacterium]KRD61877.1 glycosyl transferase [Flavobacterium sp. Root935]TDX12235.1 exopolysaccharide biosynthesis WecB/TagA/CpsF family protein [Flavobacterium sp. S87F.05.LMB.W.Kidney.N]